MSRKQRNHYTPEQKVTILRRHLIDRVPVSDLCEELSLPPTVFYRWQKQLFENGSAAFEPRRDEKQREARTIQALQEKLQAKHMVVSELMEEHIALRKQLGEL